MSVEKLKKIEIVALKQIQSELLEILQHHGIVHITKISDAFPEGSIHIESRDLSSQFEDAGWLGQIEYALHYLKKFEFSNKGLLESLMESPIETSKEDIRAILSHFDLAGIIKTCKEMDKTAHSLEAEKQEITGKIKELANWESLDVSMKDIIEGTKFLNFYTILVPTDQMTPLKKGLESSFSTIAVYQIQDMITYQSLLIMSFKSDKTAVEDQITHYEGQVVSLPMSDKSVIQYIERLKNRLEEIEKEQMALQEKGEKLLEVINQLKILYDHYRNQGLRKAIQDRFAFTDQTFIITGWVRENNQYTLVQSINHFKGKLDIEIFDPGKNEVPPVSLSNNRFASPFTLVTKLYDLPHYHELDPTPILAPFFFLFFGLCLTDLGYGLLIALVTYWGLKRFYLKKGGRDLLQLFFLCGISTVVCGALAGSWFGDIINYLPEWFGFLKKIKDSLALIDPIKDPLKFLILALSLGYIQVVTGILVQMYKEIKAKDFFGAFLIRLPWVIFLTSLILFVVVKGKNQSATILFKWMALSSALIICLCEARKENNILKRFGTGLIALYGTVGYYADMLSYCRLLALGLATAVIANVVNQMAILSKGIPYIGFILMVVIFVGGHLFNLIINSLGGFVHTSRLQFVEFFTKFFEGGGKPFIPFAQENKYTLIE